MRGRKVKSRDCALASDLVRASKTSFCMDQEIRNANFPSISRSRNHTAYAGGVDTKISLLYSAPIIQPGPELYARVSDHGLVCRANPSSTRPRAHSASARASTWLDERACCPEARVAWHYGPAALRVSKRAPIPTKKS